LAHNTPFTSLYNPAGSFKVTKDKTLPFPVIRARKFYFQAIL